METSAQHNPTAQRKVSVPIEEQETTMNVFPKQASTPCEIYSCIPAEIARIRKYAEQYPDEVKIIKEDEIGIFATAPITWFKFKPPVRRNLTEEQKRNLASRFSGTKQNATD